MNIIFLTLVDFNSFSEHNIYCDLLREFMAKGHNVYCISPAEKRNGMETHFEEKGHLLKLRIGNTQKTNIIEKGISTLMIEPQFKKAVKKYFADVKFDLVIYSTPPITLAGVVKYIKKRDNARTYLLLKDIFPQNAIDIGLMTKSGLKGIIYRHFCKKEKELYALSDGIGCMSKANVDFLLANNPWISKEKVEVCPNSTQIFDMSLEKVERDDMRKKYEIRLGKKVFVYGGNLGKPQGIPFLIDCLKTQLKFDDRFFLIVGDGTEFGKLQSFFDEAKPSNMKLMKRLPKEDYDRMVAACDIGMLFLDHRFTIPNYPSRLLSLMQAKLPVLACTDPNTDVGRDIVDGGFGWWCESNSVEDFEKIVDEIINTNETEINIMKEKEFSYLCENFSVEKSYETIIS